MAMTLENIGEGRESDTMKKEKKEVIEETKVEKVAKTKEKDSNKAETKSIAPIVIILAIIIVLVVAFIIFKPGKQTLKEELTQELKTMGEEFYTDFYYVEISKNKTSDEVTEFLSKFSDVGVKVNLDNLSRYDSEKNKEKIKKFKNEKNESCNQSTSQAIIYPKSPYGKKDYKVKVELDCNFSSEK